MQNRPGHALTHEAVCAQVAERFSPRWLRHYARAKLRSDPVFAALADLLGESERPLLDLGCGVGLLPFYLRGRGFAAAIGGIEIDRRKIRHALDAIRPSDQPLTFSEHDVCGALPSFLGDVAMLDLLHYLAPPKQDALLHRIASLVRPGSVVIIRDCPRDGSLRFRMTYLGELFAQMVSWNLGVRLHFPTRASIAAHFPVAEFEAEERPMYHGGPFNNRLFIFRRR